jgi:hypothetical protein
MLEYSKILDEIYFKLYKRDVDFSLNIFLCGAETRNKKSLRELLNVEFKKHAKFNAVYPENIFESAYKKGRYNLLGLENDLAKYVDIIVIPLEGIGTYCELGAFAGNEALLPKIIAINDAKYKNSKSFINLGPLDLIKKHNSDNLIFFDEGREEDVIPDIVYRVKMQRFKKEISYDLENLFNLSRFILYLIAFFQPLNNELLDILLANFNRGKVKSRYVDSAIQILIQKNRIEQDIDTNTLKSNYILSEDGHAYVYEELIVKLNVKRVFTNIRSEIINDRYKPTKRNLSKDKELLV